MHQLSLVLTGVKSSIEFGLGRSSLVIAVLGILPRPALVGAVLVEAVADPLPDVDEVLGGGMHQLYRFKHIYGGAAQVNT